MAELGHDQDPNLKTTTERPHIGMIITVIVIILLVALFLLWRSKSNNSGNSQTASSTSLSDLTPGIPILGYPGPQNPPANNTNPQATNTQPVSPRGYVAGTSTPPSTSPNPQPNPTPQNFLYKNQRLGFEITLPGNWSQEVLEGNDLLTFYYTNGQNGGYIESYENTSGVTLNDVNQLLQNSPDVSHITQTTLNGIPALNFSSTSGPGIAVVTNHHIYYFRGDVTNTSLISTLKFF